MDLFFDFFTGVRRQGPGDEGSTVRALSFLGPLSANASLLDLGCGAGAQTLDLAEHFPGMITALDTNDCYLDDLRAALSMNNLKERVTAMTGSMLELPFAPDSFDVIWSEGAIFIAGFANGILDWRRYLRSGGFLAVTELSWLHPQAPQEIQDYLTQQGADIQPVSQRILLLEEAGYAPIAHFALPETSWLDNYYLPLERKMESFLAKHEYATAAQNVVESFRQEIAMYKKYKQYYGYIFYIAQKV